MADAAAKDNLAALEFISEDDANTYEGWLDTSPPAWSRQNDTWEPCRRRRILGEASS